MELQTQSIMLILFAIWDRVNPFLIFTSSRTSRTSSRSEI